MYTWKYERSQLLKQLKGGHRFSPELKSYLTSIAKDLLERGFTFEECANILGMWSGTLNNWLKSGDS